MDNMKYYNDSFAYNYDIFAPTERNRKAEILDCPKKQGKTRLGHRASLRELSSVRKAILTVLILAMVCASLFIRAEISSVKSQINGVDKEIAALESESTRLEVEIERKVSVTNLEEAATKLGMQKCEKSQVTYIKTNEHDSAENNSGMLTVDAE